MRARFWVVLGCAAALLAALIWYFLIRTDPVAEHVYELLVAMPTRGSQATIDDLWMLGPRVIPHLARNAAKRETLLTRVYKIARGSVPKGPRNLLPKAQDPGPIRAAAMEAIAGLGPLAANGAVREVIVGLADPLQPVRWHAQYAAEWLVPEYPDAVKAYRRLLADTNEAIPIRDLTVSEHIWPRLPGAVPVLTRRLEQPAHAHLAAIALRYCGSNAAPAIPLLTEILDHGVVDRAMAAKTLGAIGVVSPEVIGALARAWNDSNSWVRANAAEAFTALASNGVSVPGELISGLRDRDNRALTAKLEAFGAIGPAGRDALSTIREFADTNAARAWVTEPDQRVMTLRVQDISVNARIAICSLDPERCPSLLPELAAHITESWNLQQFLRRCRRFSNEVIAAVEPLLTTTNLVGASIAAQIILSHNSNHLQAVAVLQRNKTKGTELERRIAAERLFDSTGDTNGVWEFIEQGLAPGSNFGQWSIQWAGKMGPAAIPTLRRALWHKDKFVRKQAGMILRKMAPEQLRDAK
jgi:hypothetical protein